MPTIHQSGGYRPPVRKRHRLALSLDEREEISRGLVAKRSIRDIAAKVKAPHCVKSLQRRCIRTGRRNDRQLAETLLSG
ncbi:helix-turn-helix domain-containing protein [Klebsiella oxytoca]|uniref:helix-turn-helix domain-containing protein n=1 Tax=Klebsiella oxytoca TaxID=571 RepID=UPI003AF2E901